MSGLMSSSSPVIVVAVPEVINSAVECWCRFQHPSKFGFVAADAGLPPSASSMAPITASTAATTTIQSRRATMKPPPTLCFPIPAPVASDELRQTYYRPTRIATARTYPERGGRDSDRREEPPSGRLVATYADLPSLSYGLLVCDSTGPATRGNRASRRLPACQAVPRIRSKGKSAALGPGFPSSPHRS